MASTVNTSIAAGILQRHVYVRLGHPQSSRLKLLHIWVPVLLLAVQKGHARRGGLDPATATFARSIELDLLVARKYSTHIDCLTGLYRDKPNLGELWIVLW